METKHTKGEWLRDGKTVYYLQDVPGKFDKGMPRQENRFYVGVQGPASEEEKEANAKLIAAAPDLLEALIYAERFLDPKKVDVEFINNAIKKATE